MRCALRTSGQKKRPGFFRKQAILETESAASKQTANPQGPIAGAFSGRQIRKFERALSIAASLTSAHDVQANARDDAELVAGFELCSKCLPEFVE